MSAFETAFTAALPAFFAQFGTAATHTNRDDDEASVTVILTRQIEPFGDYGERAEPRTLIDCATSDGASVGDTWAITIAPATNPTRWRADQLLSDDGILQRYAVREVTA